MYLPKSKYKTSVAKPGEYIDSSGKEYVGSIVETFTGDVYPGKTPQTMGAKLTAILGKATSKTAVMIKRVPTEAEYEAGIMTRYFIQNLRTKKIIEVLPDYAKTWQESSKEQLVNLYWRLTGSQARVESYNQMSIQIAELQMPGLKDQILTDPLQFYRA